MKSATTPVVSFGWRMLPLVPVFTALWLADEAWLWCRWARRKLSERNAARLEQKAAAMARLALRMAGVKTKPQKGIA